VGNNATYRLYARNFRRIRIQNREASAPAAHWSWLGGSVVERWSLTGELSLVCTGPAADG